MDKLIAMNNEAEETVNYLQEQLVILSALADKQRQEKEKIAISRLTNENKSLRLNLQNLKETLTYWETINGVKQVPIPEVPVKTEAEPALAEDVEVKHEPAVPPKESQSDNQSGKKGKKPKQENKSNVVAVEEQPINVSRLKMRVGHIVNAKKHPDADGLYIEEVDLGEESTRTIISGLVKHYPLEEMQDRLAVFLINLKPAKMRGILSQGMIMCASTPEKVEILDVPHGAQIGDVVYCEGFQGEPDTQLNPKKKIWEQVQPDLRVDSNGVATYKGGAFTIPYKGICKAPTMKGCPIK